MIKLNMMVCLGGSLLVLASCGGGSSSDISSASLNQSASLEEDLAQTNERIPSGAPAAAMKASAVYPEPDIWPFAQGTPRTSGTGRYAYGAFYWADFLYDANGPQGTPQSYRAGTPTGGGYTYPQDTPNAYGNGADIFRVGIGLNDQATFWRVDWQTLIDETVPIAAFGLDTEPGGLDAGEEWPGVPGLQSEGIDYVLLMSSDGAILLDTQGSETQLGPISIDLEAGAFIVEIPKSILQVDMDMPWQVRLAAGLNDGLGRVRNTPEAFGGAPGQTPVFNVTFRDYDDEPLLNNSWFDGAQAEALSSGDVSEFAQTIDWARMGETEAEPMLNGHSNRWYVSSLSAEQLRDITSEPHFAERKWQPAGMYTGDDASSAIPQYFDRVQPYGIYVPTNISNESKDIPLTLMLHAFTQNHNQYASMPNFQRGVCEERDSICITPLGRGPAGYYFQDAEVDLWDVWHEVARLYPLDPDRTVSSGFSMGALGTYRFLIRYPDLFAAGVILAGSQQSDVQPAVSSQGGAINCNAVGGHQLENIKWNDYYHAHGSFDQLIPFAEARLTVDRMSDLGYRYRFDQFITEDHLGWTVKDQAYSAFETAITWLKTSAQQQRRTRPGEIYYTWCLDDDYRASSQLPRSDLGVGPFGPWWLHSLQAADTSLTTARVHALSGALPEPQITVVENTGQPVNDVPQSPAVRDELSWVLGDKPEANGTLVLHLTNVAQLGIDLQSAGLVDRKDALICTQSDNESLLLLTGLAPETEVQNRSGAKAKASSSGELSITIANGNDALSFTSSSKAAADCH